MTTCRECHQSFDNDKSLHGHLRKHKLKVKNYYEKYYPRLCLQTGKILRWKEGDDLESYLDRCFVDKIALNQWFENHDSEKDKINYLTSFLDKSYVRHEMVPSQIELASLPMAPSLLIYKKYFDINKMFKEKKYKTRFDYSIDYTKPLVLPQMSPEDLVINIDSREQSPYRFYSSIVGKIEEGDYCLAGKHFNGVVVERKSVSDFGGTVVSGEERFRRELDRVREHGKYLIILVEFNIHELYRHKFYGYSNPAFVSHNMRGMIRDYSECCQFVFGLRRDLCVKYMVEFLLYGMKCKDTDLQLYVDSQNSQFRNEEFSRQDLINLYK